MRLHDLKPAPGSRKNARRVGRGMGSGRGKTSGRGEKGQKSRTGFSRKRGFEGGQMPLHRRLPKRGFTNIFRIEYSEVNVSRLAALAAGTAVDPDFIRSNGLASHKRRPIKILGAGELQVALAVKAHRFSATAARKIQEAGGSIELIEMRPRGPKPRITNRQIARAAVAAAAGATRVGASDDGAATPAGDGA